MNIHFTELVQVVKEKKSGSFQALNWTGVAGDIRGEECQFANKISLVIF